MAKSLAKSKISTAVSTKEYAQTLTELKKQIQEAQIRAALSVNRELLHLYWLIGKTITERQKSSGWGTNVIEQLAKDLQSAFPGVKGFSRANIFYMRAFYLAYEKIQEPLGQLDNLIFFNISW